MQRLIHVEIVVARRRVGADRQIHARFQHPHRIGDAVAQPHVARRIVRDRGTVRAEPPHVVAIQPDAVRRDEARPQQAELLDMRGQRTAIAPRAHHRLYLRFRQMGVDADIELRRQVAAGNHELVAAMQRDCRRHRGPHHGSVAVPSVQDGPHPLDRLLPGRQAERRHRGPQMRRQRVHQARDRLVQRHVGHHRRDDGAHAGLRIGFGNRRDAFLGRQRKFDEQVVAGGAALQQHLGGTDRRRDALLLDALHTATYAAPPPATAPASIGRPSIATDCRGHGYAHSPARDAADDATHR